MFFFNLEKFDISINTAIYNTLFGNNFLQDFGKNILRDLCKLLTIDIDLLENDEQLIAVLDCAVNGNQVPKEHIKNILGSVTLNWKALDIGLKNDFLAYWGFSSNKCSFTHNTIRGENKIGQRYERNEVTDLSKNSDKFTNKGYLVCAGKSMQFGNKMYEVIIQGPHKEVKLYKSQIVQFAFVNSKLTRSKMEPEANWAYWLKEMNYPDPLTAKDDTAGNATKKGGFPGIPVFYCGDPSRNPEDATSFFMGLSRVVKIPYMHSVGQVAMRTLGQSGEKYTIPKLEQELDFARAIFGDVEGSLPSERKKNENDQDRKALKGRVAFEFALIQTDSPPTPEPEITTMMMGPKASFWPFYLKDDRDPKRPADYNNSHAILAGRKRYPVRNGFGCTAGARSGPAKHQGQVPSGRPQFQGPNTFSQPTPLGTGSAIVVSDFW